MTLSQGDDRIKGVGGGPAEAGRASAPAGSDLEMPVQFLKGAGPKRAELFEKLGVKTVEDLLHFYPRDYIDRSRIARIGSLRVGEIATIQGHIRSATIHPSRGRRDFRMRVDDGSGFIECVWFNQPYLEGILQPGQPIVVSGQVVRYRSLQLKSPVFELLTHEEQELIHTGRIVPVYPLTAGLSAKVVRGLIKSALDRYADRAPDSLPPWLRARHALLPLAEALREIHFPTSEESRDEARRRLAFEELFYLQVLLGRQKAKNQEPETGYVFTDRRLLDTLAAALPFQLTLGQEKALAEILEDLARPVPMSRLLQGDVGSGKTVVALLAAMVPIASGFQVAMMAPTELLAEQHYATVRKLVSPLEVRAALLTGRQKARARSEILAGIAMGALDLVIGTHALFQEGVRFARLGLIVVDEQHRFGVLQRAALMEKGKRPDALVMSATPIPRTLALTVYGDLDISTLREIPAGRGSVRTKVTVDSKREKLYEFLAERIREGRQAFVIYPLIEESERVDLKAATRMAEAMRHHPLLEGIEIGLLHGKMPPETKSAIMRRFVSGQTGILVSTTVVEVGIDVPNASVMLVEHADRYGLSQLHQLRGRVGRGPYPSYCILVRGDSAGEQAARRLEVLETTQDGFIVAEADLSMRGPGEFFGTKQHGGVEFRIANPARDQELLMAARKDAFDIVARDPELRDPAHRCILETLGTRYRERARLFDVG